MIHFLVIFFKLFFLRLFFLRLFIEVIHSMSKVLTRVGLAALLLGSVFLSGCLSYVAHVAGGQWEILQDRVPLDEVLASPGDYGLKDADRQKVRDVIRAQRFAVNELGLKAPKSYRTYKRLRRKYVAYQVSAAEPLRFEPVTWWFPFAGSVPYLGYFDKEQQLAKARSLREDGYDVRLQNIIAYSTLGWFDEPLLSSMLLLNRVDLVNVVIHEMAHATIYFPGDTDFNESVATFLGDEGSRLFFEHYYPDNDKFTAYLHGKRHDQRLFMSLIKKTMAKLNKLYNSELDREEKLRRKRAIIRRSQDKWRKKLSQLKVGAYSGYADKDFEPNNAHFLSYRRYFLELDLFYRGYELFDRDYREFLTFLQGLVE